MQKLTTWFYLLVFSCLVFIPGISSIPTIDRDEAHFAQATVQMLETGNFFQIRFQDKTRFQKPPGINWLQAFAVKLVSKDNIHSIWPYRIPSVLSAILSVLACFYFANRFMSTNTAAVAASLLAATILLTLEAHMAVIDASLLFSVLLMQGSLWIIYDASLKKSPISLIWPLCFWLSMSYGFVLKGVTPLVGLLSIVTLCFMSKNLRLARDVKFFSGLSLFVALTIFWLYFVNQAENSNYLLQIFQKDLLPKLQGGHESHGKPPFFHFLMLPITFWPASLFLLPAGLYAWTNYKEDPRVKFLLAWILPTWLFFDLMPTKLPQYILPLFPAIAILAALSLENRNLVRSNTLKILQVLWILLSIAIGFSFIFISYLINSSVSYFSIILCAEITALSIYCVYLERKASPALIPALLVMAYLSFFLCFGNLLPSLKPLWLSDIATKSIQSYKTSTDKPLLVSGFEEPSLVFNLGTKAVKFSDMPTILKAISEPNALALVDINALKKPENYKIYTKYYGFNYSKGKWLTLALIGSNEH